MIAELIRWGVFAGVVVVGIALAGLTVATAITEARDWRRHTAPRRRTLIVVGPDGSRRRA